MTPCLRDKKARGAAGFTLLELLVAMAVVTVGVLATVTLLTNSIASARAVRSEVIAANLAQEALEIVHNIRDLNVAGGRQWNQGMTSQSRRVDALRVDLLDLDANPPLNLDGSGFYTYQSGTATDFRRTVAFGACSPPCTSLPVTVTVMWSGRTFSAQSVITGWR